MLKNNDGFRCALPILPLLVMGSLFAFDALAEPTFLMARQVDESFDVKGLQEIWFAIHDINGGVPYDGAEKWYLSKTNLSAPRDGYGSRLIHGNFDPYEIAFLRGGKLSEGLLEVATNPESGHTNVSASKEIAFRGRRYKLVVQPVLLKTDGSNMPVRNDVYFSDGKSRTLLYGGDGSGQSSDDPFFVWAGDVDRDGEPDFIVHFFDDDNEKGRDCVFLSSAAKKGELVRNAGCE
ncbi:MAG: hypothetical protein LBE62_03375 [Azonexus sp.]|jgi:hypothetical protein|nr:hypothetical protein [Azonexus sp.]